MLFNSPISSKKADRLIQLLDISNDDHVLDVGCGNGEFLIRLIEVSAAHGLGIDINSELIAAAQKKASIRIPTAAYEFRIADIQKEPLNDASFELAICIGSTHAFGKGQAAYPNTIQRLLQLVSPGGQLLIGEGYWKQVPAEAYLQLIGDPVGIYHDHMTNILFAEQQGLITLYAAVSNEDEWDDFEWSHRMRIEREAALYPNDPAVAEKLKRSREWRDGYLRWGRSTMGFGFYLFLKPAGDAP
ncbi:MAG: class I SAM-dependent methyltransferase [Anaerolineales bacterium]|nr:class I SAM-dependent methyltransferase [Anaerolineales bacterium]